MKKSFIPKRLFENLEYLEIISRQSIVRSCSNAALQQEALSNVRPYSDVPGPRPIPLLGNTWRFFPIIGQYKLCDVATLSRTLYEKYGNLVKMAGLMGRPDLVFVYDADEAEKVFRQEGDTPYRPSMPCLVKYKSEVRKEFFGQLPGVIGVHGEPWRIFRTKVQKPILQPSVVRMYITPIETITEEFIHRMTNLKDDKEEMPNDFDNEIHKWSLECIGQVALDVRLGCLESNLSSDSEPQQIINAAKFALRNVAELELKAPYWRYIPTPLWYRYVNNMDFFRKVCMKYIGMALTDLEKKLSLKTSKYDYSLLERVLMKEKDPKIACILALDLILVGIDTISMAVCSMLYQLATRQNEQDKIHEELKKLLPDPTVKLTSSHLEQMHYLRAFIKEVFRMYSTVIGNGRMLLEDMVISGYHVPKGVHLVFPSIVTGSLPDYVSNPTEFKPSRWLKSSDTKRTTSDTDYVHPFASLPYGYGARMCLGRRFADLEMQILMAKLIRSYKLEYNYEPLEYKVTFMYAPEGELKFKLTQREG